MLLPPIGAAGRSPSPTTSPNGGSSRCTPEPVNAGVPYEDVVRKKRIKAKFRELDGNKDGVLSYEELSVILRQGASNISDKEMKLLFKNVDKNCDGMVSFDEFVDYVFSVGMDKHSRLEAEFQAAFARGENALAQVGRPSHQERNDKAATAGDRARLGEHAGKYEHSWRGQEDEQESMTLTLEEDGTFSMVDVSQLDSSMCDTRTRSGTWEVCSSGQEVLLFEGGAGPAMRLRIAGGHLEAGTKGSISGEKIILQRQGGTQPATNWVQSENLLT